MRLFFLCFFLVWGFSSPVDASVGDDDWHEVRSSNFQIFTNGDTGEVKALAGELERFRSLVMLISGTSTSNGGIPYRIYATRNRGDFKQFFSQFNVVGVFTPSVRGHYSVIDLSARTADRQGRPVRGADVYLKHEYVHFVLRGGSRVRYPYWYEEGFAEYLSTLEYEDGEVSVGFPVIGRHMSLNREFGIASVDSLLDSTRLDRTVSTETLYAQGWLLVYYLHSDPALSAKVMDYLKRYDETGNSRAAFNEVFALDQAILRRKLTKLAESGRYAYRKFRPKEPLPEPVVTVRSLSPAETWLTLADVLSHFRSGTKDYDEVAEFYRKALERDPLNRNALAGMANLALDKNDLAGAAALLAQVPSDAGEPAVLIARGKLSFARAMAAAPSRREAAMEGIARARNHYLDALSKDPHSAEAFFNYGLTYLGSTEEPREGLLALQEASRLVPSDSWVSGCLAVMQLQAAQFDEARKLAERVATVTASREAEGRARQVASLAAQRDSEGGRALAEALVRKVLSGKPEDDG